MAATRSAITIEIPASIERHLKTEWGDRALSRRALEALALEGYRSEVLSAGQVAETLGLSVWETETFLMAHDAWLHTTFEDFEADRKTLELFLSEGGPLTRSLPLR